MLRRRIKTLIITAIFTFSLSQSAYAWGSVEGADKMDTHKTISMQALEIIKNDLELDDKVSESLKVIENNLSQYKLGSIAPDMGTVGIDRDYQLYQDHFFDPDTDCNFTCSSFYPLYIVPDNAESQSRNYIGQAVAAWKDGDKSRSVYLLGKAFHYFEDLNEPHHALNWTGGLGTAHTNFENYVEENKDIFKISSVGSNKSVFDDYKDKSFNEFVSLQSYKYATLAKSLEPKVSMRNSWEDWREAATISMTNAQTSVATMLYRFLNEVTYGKEPVVTSPIGKFHVIITTDDITEAGTDDYMKFGMELSNGKKIELDCDLPGNDFSRNSTYSYQYNVTDETFNPNEIRKVWIRKERYIGDDWKGKQIEIYMHGKRVFKTSIDKWLSGNNSLEFSINGFN